MQSSSLYDMHAAEYTGLKTIRPNAAADDKQSHHQTLQSDLMTRSTRCDWPVNCNSPTSTVVCTSDCPPAVVAYVLIEFNNTVMTGGVVSAEAAEVAEAQMEVAGRQAVSVEHLLQ